MLLEMIKDEIVPEMKSNFTWIKHWKMYVMFYFDPLCTKIKPNNVTQTSNNGI